MMKLPQMPATFTRQQLAVGMVLAYALGIGAVYWATRPAPVPGLTPEIPDLIDMAALRAKWAKDAKPCNCASEVVHLEH